MISIIASSAPGLSPLMRGTHMNVGSDRVFTRFIPAGAGNTVLDHFKFTIDSVYPRWRGEHFLLIAFATVCNGLSPLARGTLSVGGSLDLRGGLSPLARGTLLLTPAILNGWRFIPAGAGNTRIAVYAVSRFSVYPRWRGEHSINPHQLDVCGGLSPLARGTRG